LQSLLGPMSQHHDAIAAFQQGRCAEALRLLEELLAVGETSDLWNDWAAVQLGLGNISQAENGFTRALELDPQNTDAAANLGLLLLGRGDPARAIPLLTRALPALPPQHQKLVADLLAAQAAEHSTHGGAISTGQTLRVLVISDTFPNPAGDGCDLRLLDVLRALREQGNEVSYVVRDAEHREQCEPQLLKAGIRIYGNDRERLPCLGREASGGPSWCFRELLKREQFDVAIMTQSFRCGISVPEQYLDELRLHSGATKIVILVKELHHAPRHRNETSLADFEAGADWVARQSEVLEQADLVLVPSEGDVVALRESGRDLQVEAATQWLRTAGLAGIRQRIFSLPRIAPGEPCSVMLIETLFRERLAARSGEDRLLGQLECYVRLAEQLLGEGHSEKALEQLRHIFGRSPESMQAGYFSSQVFIVLKRCYRQRGDVEMAERCGAEARRRVVVRAPAVAASQRRQSGGPLASVIVPTYNRLPILRKCLAALEAQTLPSTHFEVIVIDDGSSDATQELLTQYRPPFLFHYLRQKNSGTGAARRNGVAHASGEYLLLMNDDTICDRDLLKQHLQVHRKYAPERWAVLGNFEYPAAARHRALTEYFCVEPFMFPQVSMEEACPYGYSHFITCNLSIRRDAVVEAGSFDSTYKLSEDTELGIRLFERGYRVFYHPDAHALHDHLPYPARNLIRRARVYGEDYFYMFGKHPRVMEEWAMPVKLTAMDEENALRILAYVEEHHREVEEAVEAVGRWDSVDFEPLLADQPETASMVLRLFRQAVPAIHWFYLFETMLHTMIRELGLNHMVLKQPVLHTAQSAGR
jgi:glycosyltransferase involved in cell wall biosynthesis